MIVFMVLILLAVPSVAQSTFYWIAPSGSNSNNGTGSGTPWLTFTYALAHMTCGDTLVIRNGTYGDGTSSGKILLTNVICSLGNEITIIAENQRQAKIVDNGSGSAVKATGSAYFIFDGLYARSTDNSGSTSGYPFFITGSNHFTLRNSVGRNPNRYANTHVFAIEHSQDGLLEDNEAYTYHRHCVEAPVSARIVSRRTYCNPRGGRIAGGFGAANGLNKADAGMSMYPCDTCIQENSIVDAGTSAGVYLFEMNAPYDGSVLMSGSKILGSICIRCNYGNGGFLNSRKANDLNHTPQNATLRDIAFVDWGSASANAVRVSDGVGIVADHITVLGTGTGANGLQTDDAATGVTSAQNSIAITNTVTTGITGGRAFNITGFATATGDRVWSFGNGSTGFPANFTNTSTANPNFGTCKGLWPPDASPLKGAGTSGSDVGATILYRYVNGVLTTTPLWDPSTGEFPHGATDVDGTNAVAGDSLFDVHTRLNVKTGACLLPAGYGGGGVGPSFDPTTRTTSTNLTGPHVITIPSGMKSLTVGFMAWDDGQNVGYATDVQSSCGGGQAIPLLATPTLTTPAYRSVSSFGIINPSSGTCTLTPTLTGTIDGWVMISIMDNNTASYGSITGFSGLSATPSGTGIGNPDYKFIDFLATSPSSTLSVGPWQTETAEVSHGSVSIRGASSLQLASNDTIMSYTLGIAPYWAMQVIPLVPPAAGGGTGEVITQTQYQIFSGHGSEDGAMPLAAKNTSADIASGGMFRARFELQGTVATTTPFGVALFCRRNADVYSQVMDTYGSNTFRFFGAGVEAEIPRIPASLTPTTQRLGTGTFVPGAFIRDQSSVFIVPALPVGTKTEMAFAVVTNASEGDVVNCRVQKDDGSQLSAYNVVSAVTIIPSREIRGY